MKGGGKRIQTLIKMSLLLFCLFGVVVCASLLAALRIYN